MRSTPLSRIADWTDGALIQGTPSVEVRSIGTDSRKLEGTELFVALKGDNFDAHDYLGDVAKAGVSAMLVSSLPESTESYDGALIRVKDTLTALQRLAYHHRKASADLHVVGLTGSNGKTSTKDFVAAVLSSAGQVNKTQGNLNNHIGLPLTILSGSEEDRFGVWEMGMNHPGEIEVLAEIAQPDAAVVTNIGTAHIEFMETRENIAKEKASLPMAVPESGYCVMPAEDDFFEFVKDRCKCEMISVGIETGQVQARNLAVASSGGTTFEIVSDFGDTVEVTLPVRGRHMVQNALLAAAVGFKHALKAETIASALSNVEMTGGRLQERVVGGVTFLDDSYNANPDSMAAALTTLRDAEVAGKRIAVLGFMGELGEHEEREHRALGEKVAGNKINVLITVGERASRINEGADGLEENRNFETHGDAAEFLKSILTPDDMVLVKGSRAAAMEKVIELAE